MKNIQLNFFFVKNVPSHIYENTKSFSTVLQIILQVNSR